MSENNTDKLLTPQQARQLVTEHVRPLRAERVALSGAAFRFAAETVRAEQSYPWFSFSAMDGFAVCASDLEHACGDSPVSLPVAGEIRAGNTEGISLAEGGTLKIMTGAPLPDGADAVVMKEVVTEKNGHAVFHAPVKPWTAVNRAGEEIQPGRVLVEQGARLTPPSLGLLAAMGIADVTVHSRPRVGVLTTGDELVAAGEPRGRGRIFDSISPMLTVAFEAWGAGPVKVARCRDNKDILTREIASSLKECDIVIVVGGVSVGDYDYTVPAMDRAGIVKIFHGVRQKPGKPLYFGSGPEGQCVFGLPGNPASALVCVAIYVRPALEILAGAAEPRPRVRTAVAAVELVNRTGRTQFTRVTTRISDDGLLECAPAGGQGSYMLASFAVSDALAQLPPGPAAVRQGETVQVYGLGWS